MHQKTKDFELNHEVSGPQKRHAIRCALPIACLILGTFVWLSREPFVATLPPLPIPRYENGNGDVLTPSPYGVFPKVDDPFHFLPCTNNTLPPPIDDPNPDHTWAGLFDPDPRYWRWGASGHNDDEELITHQTHPYSGRGIYLCGYLDLPLDYHNESDPRIVRLAVNRFQVSGLALAIANSDCTTAQSRTQSAPGHKSRRTIVIEPGGPGGSGTGELMEQAEDVTKTLSDGQFDVLGWDPRGVNASQPALNCYPDPAYRDRWKLLRRKHREELADPISHLRTVDAINNATFLACHQLYGDLGRFLTTTSVARDLDNIRKALNEEELTGYLVSYGTAIGQLYASMFPSRVGRLIFDGTDNYKNYRELGGFAWYSLDNVTDAWHDGLLGECIKAGPQHCALAKPPDDGMSGPVTLDDLESRMKKLLQSLIELPLSGYTKSGGPSLITHSQLSLILYGSLYDPKSWPDTAQMLLELEAGNSTLAAKEVEYPWYHSPTSPLHRDISAEELLWLVVCADASNAPQPDDGLIWWDSLWANMTDKSWISATFRFSNVFPCRHFNTYWPSPPDMHRGNLAHSLETPVIFIAGTYDPATPLRHARKLAKEMGKNARLIVHHGYGHTSREDVSDCTNAIKKLYMLNGTLPEDIESHCYANEQPYVPRI
jgi:pimeloyl-ACP methyl ester carboxylesterase